MSGTDIGLLIVRLLLGGLVFAHGTRKLFGWFGGAGLAANAAVFEAVGYRPGLLMAVTAGLCEAGGGVLTVSGIGTALAGALVLGSMINAAVVQSPNGFWFANKGMEYPLMLGVLAVALVFTGPGRASIAQAVGWNIDGPVWGVVAVAAAVVGAAGVLGRRRAQQLRLKEQV